jgi:hypothetical protein
MASLVNMLLVGAWVTVMLCLRSELIFEKRSERFLEGYESLGLTRGGFGRLTPF